MKYKYVLFDLDGTLIDTSEGIISSLLAMKHELDIEELDMHDTDKYIGPPLTGSFTKYLGLTGQRLEKALEIFRKSYSNGGQKKAKLYDQIEKTLEVLKNNGIKIGVATLKLEEKAVEVLEHFGLAQYFDAICGAQPTIAEATKKDIILKAIDILKAEEIEKTDNTNAVLIGDSIYDATGAKEAGIDFIPVTYGFGGGSEYENIIKAGKNVAKTPNEVIKFII